MSQNLPLNLNNSSVSKPQISAHAQNLATSQLRQKKDILNAKTSVGKALRGSDDLGPTSSISMIGNSSSSVSTSVSHAGIKAIENDNEVMRDEIRDRLRFKHIRQMMKDKKNNPDKDKK